MQNFGSTGKAKSFSIKQKSIGSSKGLELKSLQNSFLLQSSFNHIAKTEYEHAAQYPVMVYLPEYVFASGSKSCSEDSSFKLGKAFEWHSQRSFWNPSS